VLDIDTEVAIVNKDLKIKTKFNNKIIINLINFLDNRLNLGDNDYSNVDLNKDL